MCALQAILFDFDDTLSDEIGSFEQAVRNAVEAVFGDRRAAFESVWSPLCETARAEWRASAHWHQDYSLGVGWSEIFSGGFREGKAGRLLEAESERIRPIVWSKVLAELGIDDEPLESRLSEASRIEGTGPHDPYPGVRESLAHLADRFPLGLVTNGNSDIQRRKLARSGLEEYFKTVVVSGDVGLQTLKPDPAPFQRALKSIGANPQNAVMVGNDPVNDIQGAASLGMKTIWVNMALASFDTPGKPDHEINHMSEVPSVIGMLS